MALRSLAALDAHRSAGAPPVGYPATLRTLYAPTDDVHGALAALVASATRSVSLGMYALTDKALADAVRAKLADPRVRVQITLDASQAATAAERALLTAEAYPASSLAIGESEHGSLMHLKMAVIDGWDTVTGSTNWSASGQWSQDNALVVIRNRPVASEAQARLDAIHAHILSAGGR